jgi:two-component system, NarL family, sensor histidine kinase EvgS
MTLKQVFVQTNCLLRLFLICLCLIWGGGLTQSALAQNRIVRVGFYQNAPKIYSNAQGQVLGFFPALLNEIADKEGWQIDYIACEWKVCLEKLAQGKLDLMPDVAETYERRDKFSLTNEPFLLSWSRLYFQPNSELKTLLDLDRRTVAVLKDSHQAKELLALTKQFEIQIQLVPVDSFQEAFILLSSKKVDAALVNQWFGTYFLSSYDIQESPFFFFPSRLFIASPRNQNSDLRAALDQRIRALKADKNSIYYKLKNQLLNSPILKPPLQLSETEVKWLKAHSVWRVGNEVDWPPFDFQTNGNVMGYSPDYLQLIAERLNVKLVFKPDTWQNLLEKIKKRDLDLLPSVFKYPPEREQFLNFSDPYKGILTAIVVNELPKNKKIESVDDLNGHTVALLKGDSLSSAVEKLAPQAKYIYFDNFREIFASVALGKADAIVVDLPVAHYWIQNLSLTNLRIKGEAHLTTFREQKLHLGVRKDWAPLIPILNKTMQNLSTVDLQLLEQKWLTYSPPVLNKLYLSTEEKAWLKQHPKLLLGYNPDFPPFDFSDNQGDYRGIMRDYIDLIEKRLGVEINPVSSRSWKDALAKIKGKEVDLLGTIHDSQDYSDRLLRTNPFLNYDLVLLTRNRSKNLITGLENFAGQRVAFVTDAKSTPFLVGKYPRIFPHYSPNSLNALEALASGQVDAAVVILPVAAYLIQEHHLNNLEFASPIEFDLPGRTLGVRKDWPILQQIINKAMNSISEEEKQAISQKWVPLQRTARLDYALIRNIILAAFLIILLVLVWNWLLQREIRARKKVEQLLTNSEQRFRSLVEGISEDYAFFSLDRTGKILYISPSILQLVGQSAESLIGNYWYQAAFFSEQSEAQGKRALEQILAGQSISPFEVNFELNGKSLAFEVIEGPALDADKKIIGVEGLLHNITLHKEWERNVHAAKENAERASQSKSMFLSNMSHEIRTPMNAILGFSHLLKDRIKDPQNKRYLAAINDSADALLHLINDILDLSKIEAGKLELCLQPTDIRALFHDLDSLMRHGFESKGLDFELVLPQSLPSTINLDGLRLRQVLLNLLSNAQKFTAKGHVKLEACFVPQSENIGTLSFLVSDTGIGISEEAQKRIFSSFEQENTDFRHSHEGSGLGLAISSNLVNLMAGRITVSSHTGQGSVFRVDLPTVEVVHPPPIDLNQMADVAPGRFFPARLLLVDDIENNLLLLESLLEPFPFQLLRAKNGKEALELAAQHQPHLILMDIKMPVMDGITALEHLQTDPELQNIPVIAVTAFSLHEEETDIRKHGFHGYLRKPIERDQLRECLQSFLAYRTSDAPLNNLNQVARPSQSILAFEAKHALLQVLQSDIWPAWLAIKDSWVVDELEGFVGLLQNVAQNYPFEPLFIFSEKLRLELNGFELDLAQATLQNFPQELEHWQAALS